MQMLSPVGPCVACSADKADWVASHAAQGTCLSHRPAHHEHVLTPIWLCRFETEGHRFGVEEDARWGKKLCDASIRTDGVSLDIILRRCRAQPAPSTFTKAGKRQPKKIDRATGLQGDQGLSDCVVAAVCSCP